MIRTLAEAEVCDSRKWLFKKLPVRRDMKTLTLYLVEPGVRKRDTVQDFHPYGSFTEPKVLNLTK